MKFNQSAVRFSAVAHILAWVAFLFLACWPLYQGASITPVGPDGSGGEAVPLSASIIEVNGWWVLVPLLAPVLVTGLGLVVTWAGDDYNFRSKLLIWMLAALLLVFCGLAMFSVGVFYLPAALALLVSAIVMSVKARPSARQIADA